MDKSVDLSKHMKDSFVRTKEKVEETREPRRSSPTEYAADSVQEKAQGVISEAAHHIPNPVKNARRSIDRARGHFGEVKRQTPKERQKAAEQAQNTANNTKVNADRLKDTAGNTQKSADKAKSAVKDAKQTLKQVRQDGRQTLREVRQKARLESHSKPPRTPKTANSTAAPRPPSTIHSPLSPIPSQSSPGYLHKGVGAGKDTVKSAEQSAKAVKSTAKGFKNTAKGTVKTAKKTVKTAEQTAKQAIKTAQRTAKAAQKTAQASAKAAKMAAKTAQAAAKAAVQAAKAAAKATAALVKATIAAVKGMIAVIAAGGWIAVLVIVIICLIGLLAGSIFGIFFSSEPDAGTGQTVTGVISEINSEYTGNINNIKNSNAHDLLDMSGARAGWKEVLAVYTVRTVSDRNNPMEVATMDDAKAAILRTVFREMNTVSHTTDTGDAEEDIVGADGLPSGGTTTVTKTVLRITVSRKTPGEMAARYGFTEEQKEWLNELLKPEYHGLWNSLLYGITSVGDGTMLEFADTQIGNIGGEPYWSWYGFSSRVEWCAIFVSWCAGQSGYIDTEVIPLFAYCPFGANWFMERGQWQDNTYTPNPGDIIFFDWEPDGETDHVGIVENVTDGMVNTIEGNTGDSVARRSYEVGSVKIYGFGTPELK